MIGIYIFLVVCVLQMREMDFITVNIISLSLSKGDVNMVNRYSDTLAKRINIYSHNYTDLVHSFGT